MVDDEEMSTSINEYVMREIVKYCVICWMRSDGNLKCFAENVSDIVPLKFCTQSM